MTAQIVLTQTIKQTSDDIEREEKARPARKDAKAFREYVIKDDRTNAKIKQEPIHTAWIEHIERCKREGLHCAILAPWGHGKSVQIAIAETLRLIGENHNIRIKIINAIDQYAMDRVKALKAYIERDDDYHAVYPDVKRGDGEWTSHRIYVNRDSMAIDPTIEARGITSTGVSGRADVLIFDDPVDDSSITSEAVRSAARQAYRNVWMSRLTDDGFAIYICTRWSDDDLTRDIIDSGRYLVLIQRVSDDFTCITQEIQRGKTIERLDSVPLCSFWGSDALRLRYAEIGEAAFNRGYRQRGIIEGELLFRHFVKNVRNGEPPKAFHHYIGVDLAGEGRRGTIIFTVGCNENMTQKWIVDIQAGAWSSPETAERIAMANSKYIPHVIHVENNAYQQSLIDWMKTKGYGNLPIQPFTTGKQKASSDIGLPALDVQFERGIWTFYMPDHDVGCRCAWCTFSREMRHYPVCETSDTVMAFWFAERASVLYGSVRQAFPEQQDTHKHAVDISGIVGRRW